jgi:activator of HSP90 ATPase
MNCQTPNRRQWIVGAITTGIATSANCAKAGTDDGVSRAAESIHQQPVFRANRQRVYQALTEARQFDKVVQLSGAMQSAMSLGSRPTEISRQLGGTFTLFGGHIVGRHLELIPNERIVQAWRVVDWNPGVYSIAKFELTDHDSGAKIVFDHTGFPEGQGHHLAAGWIAHYWEPLRKYLVS